MTEKKAGPPHLDAVGWRKELERRLAIDGHDAVEQAPVQAAPAAARSKQQSSLLHAEQSVRHSRAARLAKLWQNSSSQAAAFLSMSLGSAGQYRPGDDWEDKRK